MKKFHLIFVLLSLFMLVASGGCSSNIKLSRPAYGIAMGLLNTCARKDQTALAKLKNALEAPVQRELPEEQISEEEKSLILSIISQAEEGEWEQASDRVRQLLDHQATATSGSSPAQRHQHR